MKRKALRSRRATILLMVVSLLALLFLIVTGFLALARVDRGMVVDLHQAELTQAIAEDTEALAVSLIKDQLQDEAGEVLGGGSPQSYSSEDVAGYRKSNWLAPLEPVWDAAWIPGKYIGQSSLTGAYQLLEQILWPAVTSLDAVVALPERFPLFKLMRDYDYEQTQFQISDVKWNARNPFMDADGDGVPDSQLLLTGPATELANTAARRSVEVPPYDPNPANLNRFLTYAIPVAGSPGLNYEKWQRYDAQARYEVALRIISHGGMVTLDSPTLYDAQNGQPITPFNRHFVVDLFDAVRPPTERNSMAGLYPYGTQQHALFDALHANAPAIERALRRRGQIPSAADEQYGRYRLVPPVLAELYGELPSNPGFPLTFGTLRTMNGSAGAWQRVNVAGEDGDAVGNWGRQAAFDATQYNTTTAPNDPFLSSYQPRHLITTVNYSDDLARKQAAGDPNPADANLDNRLKTYRGELKFYLGEIAKAYVEVGSGQYAYDYRRGAVIIQRLARVFYDMLSGYEEFTDADVFDANATSSTGGDPEQVVSRRQQAFMLALNVLGFATSRDTNDATRGFIDVVSYVDVDAGGVFGTEYVGYAPQPFFSEGIAYNKSDPDEPPGEEQDHVAIAVELYNPNDPLPGSDAANPDSDPFALFLPQFGIAVNGVNPNAEAPGTNWRPLGVNSQYPTLPPIPNLAERIMGRGFTTFVIRDAGEGTDHFNGYVGGRVLDLNITAPSDPDDRVKLDLWRQGRYYDSASGTVYWRWFHVDRIQVEYPDRGDWSSRYRDLAKSTTALGQPYFGVLTDPVGRYEYWARWSVVCAWDDDDTIEPPGGGPTNPDNDATGSEPSGPSSGALNYPPAPGQEPVLGSAVQFRVNVVGGNSEASQPIQLPITPLMTMNAGPVGPAGPNGSLYKPLTNLPMFGALDANDNPVDPRPRSFPTVGFMLFVPRYSHVHRVSWVSGQWQIDSERMRSMSQTLEKDRQRNHGGAVNPWQVPADFGHMPIFDNTQDVKSDTYLDEVGEVPWGLLVFDYFTTIDPQRDANADGQPDVDPLQIPGRININTAPWYVLANLPMLGPDADGYVPITPTDSSVPAAGYPSPSFWDPYVAVLSGVVNPGQLTEHHRLLATDQAYEHDGFDVPWRRNQADWNKGRYRLGPWLAQAAAAYRDGVQYVRYAPATDLFAVYADSHLRGGEGALYGPGSGINALAYRPTMYGSFGGGTNGGIRGAAQTGEVRPRHYGFVTVGELLNVKGFDSSRHDQLPTAANPLTPESTTLGRGDFVKAVSLLALLDSQYLTTRSNTFTIYASVMDREDPQASMRSQTTVDRGNLLPRLSYAFYDPTTGNRYPLNQVDLSDPANAAITQLPLVPMLLDLKDASGNATPDGVAETPMRLTNDDAEPRVIARQRVGYFNARYDD